MLWGILCISGPFVHDICGRHNRPNGVPYTMMSDHERERMHTIWYKPCFWVCDGCVVARWPRWFGDDTERPPASWDMPYRWWEQICMTIAVEQWGYEDRTQQQQQQPWFRWIGWLGCCQRRFRFRPA